MDQCTSDDRLTKMRSVMSIRCLPKILPSSSTSPVHRLPPWGDLWREQMSRLELGIFVTVNGKNVRLITSNSSPNPVQYDISPHRHSQPYSLISTIRSDLTIRLYSTTSLKSISLKRWLYHQMFQLSYWSVPLYRSKSRDQSYLPTVHKLLNGTSFNDLD